MDALPKGRYSEAIEQLAEMCGVTPNHLRKIANYNVEDNNEAKPSHLYFIAEYFEVTIDDLLNKEAFEKKIEISTWRLVVEPAGM